MGVVVDLRSDTVSRPSPAMREAIATAVVGDDVFKDDPTVNELERKIAELSGKEAGLLVPTGTMGNLICVLAHCWERGSELLLGDMSHIHIYEQGGVSQLGGVHPRSLKNKEDGTFSLEELELKIRGDDQHLPVTRLVAIENSHNKCGGRALPLPWIRQVGEICRKNSLDLLCDGARIFNSCVSQGVNLKTMLEPVDSASICLSKGLGCPIGSVIVGSKLLIQRAIRLRKVLGGGMRQAGILAAAGIYALDNMVQRLEEDHAHARILATAINEAGNNRFVVKMESVETNIVIMWVDPAITSPNKMMEELESGDVQVRTVQFSPVQIRFTFHCDISRSACQQAVNKVTAVIRTMLL